MTMKIVLRSLLLKHAHHVVLAQHEKLLAFDFDFRTTVLPKEDLIAHFYIERAKLAVIKHFSLSDGDHFTPDWLLGRRVRDN